MTCGKPLNALSQNAVPPHFECLGFYDFAEVQLADATPWEHGVCFLPECGCHFAPKREWQIYCSDACKRAGTAEMRRWGHRLAMAALCWRLGRDRRGDLGRYELAQAGQRHMTHVLSAWLADRQARAAGRGQ